METSLCIFLLLGLLLLTQSLASLCDGIRFLRYVRWSAGQPPSDYVPRSAVIIPVKGVDLDLEQNVLGFLTQQYPQYQLVLVVENENDPAFGVLTALLAKAAFGLPSGPKSATLQVAGTSRSRGQKVHNLLRGLGAVGIETEVLIFADADARPGPQWLRCLVGPLANPAVTVSTGFRWYLPGKTIVSWLRAAWDTSIATMLGERGRNFPWGGSMAIRAKDFKRMAISEHYWASTVSDDYAVGRAVKAAGGWIRFEPRCLLASREDSSFREFLRWANRQMIITRVYAPRLWALGLISHVLYGSTFILGMALLLSRNLALQTGVGIAAFLAGVVALGMAKGRLRTTVASEVFPKEARALKKTLKCYWLLSPLVPWVMLWNLIAAGFTRRIEWRGVHYHLRSDREVEIIRREPA